MMYKKYTKVLIDFVGAGLLIIILAPIVLFIAVVLTFSFVGSPFFLQERAGYKGRIFKIIKFRTMTNEKNDHGILLPDHKRVTVIGGVIRKLSLDELPQIFNIIKRDMSFVGPRPFLSEYLAIYSLEECKRHDVLPGITGLAQVMGRNSISWKEKFKWDVKYVDNVSFWMDLDIIIMTVWKIVKRDGVNKGEDMTMEKYNGKN